MNLLEARRQSHQTRNAITYDIRFSDDGVVVEPDNTFANMMGGMTAPEQTGEDLFGFTGSDVVDTAKAAGRAVAGGVQDTVTGVVGLADDIGTAIDNKIGGLGYITMGPDGLEYTREKVEGAPRLDELFDAGLEELGVKVPQGDSPVEAMARSLVQFGAGMVAAPIRGAGYVNTMLRGGFADALFDPEEGNLSTFLKEFGLEGAVLDFLDSKVDDEATAIERLGGRLTAATEGLLTGGLLDVVLQGFKAVRSDEGAVEIIRNKLATVKDRLTQPGDMPTVGSLGGNIGVGGYKPKLNKNEINFLKSSATKNGELDSEAFEEAKTEALRIKANYPPGEGWANISIAPNDRTPSFTKDKQGNIKTKFAQPSYEFNKPKNARVKPETHQSNMVSKMVTDIEDLVTRAKNGDQKAKEIIEQANWYRNMRTRLRKEFGGLGDVFADLLGATSAQTGVQQNYENSLQILRRFTRGEFDKEIKAYEAYVQGGGKKGPAIFRLDADTANEFQLIRKASGEMFGANSPAATEALLDMFRQIKVGSSPKTVNFTGNLIGYGNDATIDVWAARYLRKISGRDRIPPPAEPGVTGKHLTGSTLDNPRIGQEFAFGQTVFKDAVNKINADGTIKSFDASLGDMGPDDLQAVVWFLEKEQWTNNGWTSKVGEGGSLDFESKFGGSPDRERAAELRSIINRKGSTPEQIAQAEQELATLEGEAQRFVAGVSRERPDQVPTNVEQAELASELTAPLNDDKTVIGYQANNAFGEFMGEKERSLNFEIVTQTDFDPTELTNALVEAGRKYDQDAVFLSKVVDDTAENARPGVEVYFKRRETEDYVRQLTAILREKGLDGFTAITDSRQSDRVDVQASTDEATAGLTGIRFQYIPEFDDAFDEANAKQIFAEKEALYEDVMRELGKIDGITYADVVYYDTQVFKNTDRSGTEWINGGVGYGEHLGTAATKTASAGGN